MKYTSGTNHNIVEIPTTWLKVKGVKHHFRVTTRVKCGGLFARVLRLEGRYSRGFERWEQPSAKGASPTQADGLYPTGKTSEENSGGGGEDPGRDSWSATQF